MVIGDIMVTNHRIGSICFLVAPQKAPLISGARNVFGVVSGTWQRISTYSRLRKFKHRSTSWDREIPEKPPGHVALGQAEKLVLLLPILIVELEIMHIFHSALQPPSPYGGFLSHGGTPRPQFSSNYGWIFPSKPTIFKEYPHCRKPLEKIPNLLGSIYNPRTHQPTVV